MWKQFSFVLAITIACSSFASLAKPQEKSWGTQETKPYMESLIEGEGYPMVAKINISGKTLEMAVDLSVNGVVFNPDTVKLPGLGEIRVKVASSGKTVKRTVGERLGELELKLGDSEMSFRSESVKASVAIDDNRDAGKSLDGLIGASLLKNSVLYVSNTHGFFSIVPKTRQLNLFDAKARFGISKSGLACIGGCCLEIEENWVMHTGANFGIALKRADFQRYVDTGLIDGVEEYSANSFGGHVKVRFGTMAVANVFDMEISQISICELDHYGIGLQVLRELDFVADSSRNTFSYARRKPQLRQ